MVPSSVLLIVGLGRIDRLACSSEVIVVHRLLALVAQILIAIEVIGPTASGHYNILDSSLGSHLFFGIFAHGLAIVADTRILVRV